MLVIAFIVVFILGAIAGIGGMIILASKWGNMNFDEICEVGGLMIEAGNNRESRIELTYDGDFGYGYNSVTLESR